MILNEYPEGVGLYASIYGNLENFYLSALQ
jgi:hypothetical protein